MSERLPPFDDRELLKLLESGMNFTAAAKALDCPVDAVRGRAKRYVDCGVMRKGKCGPVIDWKAFAQWQKIRKTLGAALEAFQEEQA